MEDRLEVVVIQIEPSVSEEVLKDVVSPDWRYLSKDNVVVVGLFELIWKSIVCLIHFDEFFVGLLVSKISLGVVLDGKFSVGFLDVVKGSSLWDSEHLVIIAEGAWVIFIEELFFLLIDDSMLIEESIESRVCVFQRVLLD